MWRTPRRRVAGWAKLSAGLEPIAFDRAIYGFDTFEGFPSVNEADLKAAQHNPHTHEGGFHTGYDSFAELQDCIAEFDQDRFLTQFQKVFLVKGDATQTIPQFIEANPHVLVSLLFLDFDLYAPTKVALEHFLPRMPKGAVLAFDEINNPAWPCETQAMLEALDLKQHSIQRFSVDPNIAYVII